MKTMCINKFTANMKLFTDLKEHLANMGVSWHLCGGFAIDAYLGEITRQHKDLDITVSFDDMRECIWYLKSKGWEIDAPVGNGRIVPVEFALEHSDLYFDNIWCYKKDADFIKIERTDGVFKYVKFIQRNQIELDFIEVLFNVVKQGFFFYKRNHMISLSIDKAFINKNGISILAPELVLLYKSTNHSNINYKHDFDVATGRLEQDRFNWFSLAMKTAYPQGHPWLKI